MSYLSLKKYGYNHHGEALNEYQRRFNSSDAKHIGINIGSSPAFFVETKEINKSVLALYKMDKKVMELCRELPPEAVAQYLLKCLTDEIQITNSIEGVHSTQKEILDAYENRGTRFKGIVDKYLLMLSDEQILLESNQDIRDLYDELVLPEVLEESEKDRPDGEIFRKERVFVRGPNFEPAHEGLYPEDKIIEAMQKALDYLNDEDEELIYRVAVFHYLLGYIHPFYNGNGRLNRFISSYMLTSELELIIGYRLACTIKEEQSSYNKAFDECNDEANRGELTMFVEMFVNILTESMENLIVALKEKKADWERYQSNISVLPFGTEKYYLAVYEQLILHELFAPEGVDMVNLKKATNISIPTLRKLLKNIEDAGLLKVDSSGRRFVYGIRLDKIDELLQR